MSRVKVLYLPLNYGDIIQTGMYEAFRQAGCILEVFDYFNYHARRKSARNTRATLLQKAKSFRPDLVHMQIQHTNVIDGATVRQIKNSVPNTIVTNWTGDVRSFVPKTYKNVGMHSDYNLISSMGQMPLFQQNLGKKIHYWQVGYHPEFYYPDPNPSGQFQFDITFVGNHAPRERYPDAPLRINACKICRRTFKDKFGLFGHGLPADLKSRGSTRQSTLGTNIYHKSFCNLSISHFNDIDSYFSDRLLMCMASGRPTLCYRFPNWESYFTDMCDIVIINSIDEIPKKVQMLKDNPELANYIGRSGAAKVFAEHTYYSRVKELLDIVGLGDRK